MYIFRRYLPIKLSNEVDDTRGHIDFKEIRINLSHLFATYLMKFLSCTLIDGQQDKVQEWIVCFPLQERERKEALSLEMTAGHFNNTPLDYRYYGSQTLRPKVAAAIFV